MSTIYELTPCPVCDSTEAEEVADRDAIRREVEELWGFQLRRLRSDVPVRHLLDRIVFSQHPPLRLARCAECGTIYRNPREDADSVVELYEDEEPDAAALHLLHEQQRVAYRAQAARLRALGVRRGLEVGSYIGAFLAAARDEGLAFRGIDVNVPATEFARGLGLEAEPGSLEDLDPGRTFGAVAIWNCFEQLPDPRAAGAAARRVLAVGGILALRVPNGGFYHRWRRRLNGPAAPVARAALSHNNLLGFPYRHGFTPDSLQRLLRETGFEPIQVIGDTLVDTADRWTRSWGRREAAAVKAILRVPPRPPSRKPWFEIYARAV